MQRLHEKLVSSFSIAIDIIVPYKVLKIEDDIGVNTCKLEKQRH